MRGMVLGKFLPPHLGHIHLCQVAASMCDQLTIVVASLKREPIAGIQRVAWMRELMPNAEVVELAAELPQEPAEHPAFWQLWRDALIEALRGRPDRVFTSDDYGERLAAELGAQWIAVDPTRATFPISGTAIRADPHRHWAMLPKCVRPHFLRRISVFGPESTGKSTLAHALATELGGTLVPEFARDYLVARGGQLEPADLEAIATNQRMLEDRLALDADRNLICDTDPLLTSVWSSTLFGDVSPRVRAAAEDRRYDLTLLCEVDLPWIADPVRYLPDDRAGFLARCEAVLRAAGRRYAIVRGHGEARLAMARDAIAATCGDTQ